MASQSVLRALSGFRPRSVDLGGSIRARDEREKKQKNKKKIKTNFQPQPPEYFLSCLGLLAIATTTSTTSTAWQLKCVNMAD